MLLEPHITGHRSPDDRALNPQLASDANVGSRDEYSQALEKLRQVADDHIHRITTRINTDYYADRVTPEEVVAELEAWVEVARRITGSLIHDLLAQQSLMIEEAYEELEDQAPVLSWFQKATNFFRQVIPQSHQPAETLKTPTADPNRLTPSENASARAALADLYSILESVFCRLPNMRVNTTLIRVILVTNIILTLLPTASANAPSSLSTNSHVSSPNQVATATHLDHLSTPLSTPLPGHLSHPFTPIPTHIDPETPISPPSTPLPQLPPDSSTQTPTTNPMVRHLAPTPTASANENGLSQLTASNQEPTVTPYPIERRVLHDTVFDEPSDYEIGRLRQLIMESSINVIDLQSPIYDGYDPQFKEVIGKTNITIVIRDGDQWYIQGHGSIISHYNQIFFVTANHVLRNSSLYWLEITDSKQVPNIYLIIPNLDGYDYLKMTIPFRDLKQISESGNAIGEGLCYFNLKNSYIRPSVPPLKTISYTDLRSIRGFDDEGEDLTGMIFPTTTPHGLHIKWGGSQYNHNSGRSSVWSVLLEENPVRPGDSGRGVVFFNPLTHEWYLAGAISAILQDQLQVPVTFPGTDDRSHITAVEFPD